MRISTACKQLLFASALYPGRLHDFTLFKELLAKFDFSGLTIHVDLGFLGLRKVITHGRVFIPHKASKNAPLTSEQKVENKQMARLRVVVENAIAKIKSFFVLRVENRMKQKRKLDQAFEICIGLANFKSAFQQIADY